MLLDLRFAMLALMALVLAVVLQFARPMIVMGDVNDPEGRPVRGVLGAAKHRSGAADRAAERGGSSFISGCLLCDSVRVRVSAPGFESEAIQLSSGHAHETGDRVEVNRSLFGMVQRLRVTLYPRIEVESSRLQSELIFANGEPRIVVGLRSDQPDRGSPEHLHSELRRATRGAETVAPYLALEADTDGDGSITLAPLNPGDPPNARWRNPGQVRLVLHNVDGGFILVDPLPGLPAYNGYRETRRRLRIAPAVGYARSVAIDYDRAHMDGKDFFFYLRVGERFGKGELSAIEISPSNPSRLRGHIRLWFNENGGREMPEAR